MQATAVAWEMTHVSDASYMVALVQTATFLPVMLLSLPAGAVADMVDRRRVGLAGLSIMLLSAAALTSVMMLHSYVGPRLLLLLCMLMGVGVAIITPAWQASIRELVRPDQLPSAVALSSVSSNVARSVGPAVGGLVVATLGSAVTFGVSALLYLPMAVVWYHSKRMQTVPTSRAERIDRAIMGGVRFVLHSSPARTTVLRTFVSSLAGVSMIALAPLVAKRLLAGGPLIYGLLLGAYGAGSIFGATLVTPLRMRISTEATVRWMAIVAGFAIVTIGLSRFLPITLAGFFVAGGAWMVQSSIFNVAAQLSAPSWVNARVLGCWSTSITAGVSLGAWMWGQVADEFGISAAYVLSGLVVALTASVGRWLPMQQEMHR